VLMLYVAQCIRLTSIALCRHGAVDELGGIGNVIGQ